MHGPTGLSGLPVTQCQSVVMTQAALFSLSKILLKVDLLKGDLQTVLLKVAAPQLHIARLFFPKII